MKKNTEWRTQVHGRKDAWFASVEGKKVSVSARVLSDVYQIVPNVYSVNLLGSDGGSGAWSHIIVGEEQVMIIDTGFGVVDLKGTAEELAEGKPIIVVNTHLHGDHTLGNYQFDEVYIHELDAPILQENMTPDYWANRRVPYPGAFFTQNDVVPFKAYHIQPVKDGHIFNLGPDHQVEVIHVGGHTPGNSVLLDKKNRILFSGDAIMGLTTLIMMDYSHNRQFATVRTFRDNLLGLLDRTDEFDCLFSGHGGLESPVQLVEDMLKLTEKIIQDPSNYDYDSDFRGRPCKQSTYGLASINYKDENVG